jgi:vesicle transport protein SEC22
MVRSTIIVRASDALPLAASVDDEQVRRHSVNSSLSLLKLAGVRNDSPSDRANLTRAQATSKIVIQASDIQLGAASFDREWSVYTPVCPATRCTTTLLSAHQYVVTGSYLIADNVVYLTIADKSYPRKLAFSYLDELSKEFFTSYGAKVETVRKPYAFVGFGWSTQWYVNGNDIDLTDHIHTDTFMSKTARLYQDTRAANAGSGLDRLNDDLQDVTRIMTKNMEELLWRGDSLDSMYYSTSSGESGSDIEILRF